MGLANLVPGVSGGTMLLAAGIYPQCIEAIAKVTTLRPDRNSVILLGSVAVAAAVVILLVAGTMRELVLEHRWMTYSVFLGATLGGVPVLGQLIGKPGAKTWGGFSVGLACMVTMALVPAGTGTGESSPALVLFLAGLGAFAAMLLPGLSGSYLLVLSGQYVPILGAVDGVKEAIFAGNGLQWPMLAAPVAVLVPFSFGMLAALVGMSSLIKLLLTRQRSLMLGFLLGLLVGAVLGLWPFASPESSFALPEPLQGIGALALAGAGFLVTFVIARHGEAGSPPPGASL